MKKNKLFILLWVLLNFTALFGQTAKWEIIKERPDDQKAIVDGVSDKNGNIFIATETSVLRFNGKHWDNLGTVSEGEGYINISAITIDDNNNIYIGGHFKKIGDVPVENLAKWESTTRKWTALAKFQYTEQEDGKTYIYDNFGEGPFRGGLVCINNVLHASSSGDNHVYKYVNGVWQKLGNETADTGVLIYGYLTKDANGGLYGIGKSNDYSVVAKWNGTTWTKLGNAFDDAPKKLSVSTNGSIYAYGRMKKVGMTTINYIAKWDGKQWVDEGAGLALSSIADYDGCSTMAFDQNNKAYAGGAFSAPAEAIVQKTGTQWSAFETDIPKHPNGNSCALLIFDNARSYLYAFGNYLYASGNLKKDGSTSINYLGNYRYYTKPITPPSVPATNWVSIGKATRTTVATNSTIDGRIRTMITDNNNQLYVGGHFLKIGTTNASAVAKWDGAKWSALGNGLRGNNNPMSDELGANIETLKFDNAGKLYAGGTFMGVTTAVNESFSPGGAYGIGRFDGTNWTALCKGCPPIIDIAFTTTNGLYGATWGTELRDKQGIVSDMNANPIKYIPKELASYEPGQISDIKSPWYKYLAVDKDNKLYVTGDFIKSGENFSNTVEKNGIEEYTGLKDIKYLAVWNGTSSDWEVLGNGINAKGSDLVYDKNKHILYVVGDFSEANNITAYGAVSYNIATKTWSALGVGYHIGGLLLAPDGTLYGSVFHPSWGDYYMAKWTGTTWTAIAKIGSVGFMAVDNFGTWYGLGNADSLYSTVFVWKSPTAPATTTTTTQTTTSQTVASLAPASGKKINGTSDAVSLNVSIGTGLSGGSAITIEYWFKGTQLQSAFRLQSGNSFIVAGWGAVPVHLLSNEGTGKTLKIQTKTGGSVQDNQWHHIAVTWSKGVPNGFVSYVDGEQIEAKNAGSTVLPTFSNINPVLGAFMNGGNLTELTNGELARVRVWKVARTAQEIKDNMGKDLPDNNANMLYQGYTQPAVPVASLAPASGRKINSSPGFGPTRLETNVSTNLSGGSAITIEYWFKGTQLQSAFRLQSSTDFIVAGWGAIPVHLFSNEGTGKTLKIQTKTGGSVQDNQWHHIAVTWSKGVPNGFVSYVDGEQIEAKNAGSTVLPTFTGGAVLGALFRTTYMAPGGIRNNANLLERMNGELARLRVWKVARTAQEIKDNMGKDLPDNTANMLYQGTGTRDAN